MGACMDWYLHMGAYYSSSYKEAMEGCISQLKNVLSTSMLFVLALIDMCHAVVVTLYILKVAHSQYVVIS